MRWPWQKKEESAETPGHLLAGLWGEDHAARWLGKKGFKILARRVRVGRRDELDLVARDRQTLVFVEVKTRKNEAFGRPIASVDRAKRHALSRAAIRYMGRLDKKPDHFRFDVVEVIGTRGDPDPVIRHIENAFAMDRAYRIRW